MAGCVNTKPTPADNQAPESFIKAYTTAIQALEIDDWGSMSLPLKKAKEVALNKYGNNIVISTVRVLEIIEQFDTTNSQEKTETLDLILNNRLKLVSKLENTLKKNTTPDQYLTYHKSIRKSLNTTTNYISRKPDSTVSIYPSPLDLYVFKKYTQHELINPSAQRPELLINSIQLITFSILNLKNKNIDDAYEALRAVTKVDTALLERSGYLPKSVGKNQSTTDHRKAEPSDKAGLELLESSLLLKSDKYQEAYKKIEYWIEKYPNSSNKRLGLAYLVYAESMSELNKNGTQEMYLNALNYFNDGFGKGNLLSGVVEYKLLGEELEAITKIEGFGKKAYKKKDALLGIELINNWRSRYTNNESDPESSFLEDLLIVQLGQFQYSAGVSTKDPKTEQYLNALAAIEELEQTGDLNALPMLMIEVEKQIKRTSKVTSVQFENALNKYTNEAILEK